MILELSPILQNLEQIYLDLEQQSPNTIFGALSCLLTAAFNLSAELESLGYQNEAQILQHYIMTHLDENKYMIVTLIKAAMLNPALRFEDLLTITSSYEFVGTIANDLETEFVALIQPRGPQSEENNLVRRFQKIGQKYETRNLNEWQLFMAKKESFNGLPLDFWETNQILFPTFYPLVKEIATIPPTSTDVERFFSKCKYALTPELGASSTETIERRLFLMGNSEMMRALLEDET
jgi:hypothetical protein